MKINGATVEVINGSVLRQDVDAIVNAANKDIANGSGITGAIFDAAGPRELEAEIKQKYPRGTPTGTAVITEGHKLGKKIIHTPGPKWGQEDGNEATLLQSCYRSCLEVADKHHLGSIAFCSISTGIFKYPLAEAATLAVNVVTEYLKRHPKTSLKRVVFAMWEPEEFDAFTQALKDRVAKDEALMEILLGPKESRTKQYMISDQELDSLSNLRRLRGFEGGSVSLAEGNDKFYVITNEGGMVDFMDEEDKAFAGNRATVFDTEEKRTDYAKRQGWIRG